MPVVPLPEGLEAAVIAVASWLKLGIEAVSIAIILVAMLMAVGRLLRQALGRAAPDVRMGLARGLSLALEFQLAADIVGTAISPGWDQIGKLAAVAAIRTFLNVFLQREMVEVPRASPPR
ncbi:DUF1622 domain-containing protein [Sediminicoccus rosea]|jgi:uncharacterized membrane protein|uniref:DUF1622 domain-containing protein n=1 Tax=Sediminicoccus rosea TaxID=1225128 RepID=A0ABZ0PJT8_9PROT|nr:DUF1622 domain-containing protein [Sediminicoccus rosea]WPB85994.1 DUF1622 domain-containing protein [Sediminicoccus rosea]